MFVLLMVWSLTMAAPPLTEAQKKAEYDLAAVEETLTPEQTTQRDAIPGWRPRAPLSDIERGAVEIVPGEPNPHLIRDSWLLEGRGITPAELAKLGRASPSPPGFQMRFGPSEAFWYAQLDGRGQPSGLWLAVFVVGNDVKAVVMAGPKFLGDEVYADFMPGIKAGAKALQALKAALAGGSSSPSGSKPDP